MFVFKTTPILYTYCKQNKLQTADNLGYQVAPKVYVRPYIKPHHLV